MTNTWKRISTIMVKKMLSWNNAPGVFSIVCISVGIIASFIRTVRAPVDICKEKISAELLTFSQKYRTINVTVTYHKSTWRTATTQIICGYGFPFLWVTDHHFSYIQKNRWVIKPSERSSYLYDDSTLATKIHARIILAQFFTHILQTVGEC